MSRPGAVRDSKVRVQGSLHGAPTEDPESELTGPAASVMQLQQTAGNRAVARIVGGGRLRIARQPPGAAHQGQAPVSDDQTLETISEHATKRADELAAANKESIDQLKEAHQHLREIGEAWDEAWKEFSGTLREADEEIERAERISEMIQDLALGVLFPLIGEELIAAAALKEADAIWEVSWSEFMNRDYRNVVGHVAHHAHETLGTQALHHVGIKTTEMAAGKGLQAIGEGAKATDTAGRGGASALDKYKQLFAQSGALIDALPDTLSTRGAEQGHLAVEALQLAKQLAGHHRPGNLAQQMQDIQKVDRDGQTLFARSMETVGVFQRTAAAIMSQPLEPADAIERKFWIQWVATLEDSIRMFSHGERDVLTTSAIKNRLLDLNLFPQSMGPGGIRGQIGASPGYAGPVAGAFAGPSDPDVNAIVHEAQRAWLHERGIDQYADPEIRMRGEFARMDRKGKLVDQPGVIEGGGRGVASDPSPGRSGCGRWAVPTTTGTRSSSRTFISRRTSRRG